MDFDFNKNLKVGSTTVAYDKRPDSVELWAKQLGITLSPPQERRISRDFETLGWQEDSGAKFSKGFDKFLNKTK
jgi:hypothetical protein